MEGFVLVGVCMTRATSSRRQEASMMFTSRLLPPLAVHIAPLCGSAQAAGFEVGTSIICDAQTQVGRFVALLSGETQADFDAVNAVSKTPPPGRSPTLFICQERKSAWRETVTAPFRLPGSWSSLASRNTRCEQVKLTRGWKA